MFIYHNKGEKLWQVFIFLPGTAWNMLTAAQAQDERNFNNNNNIFIEFRNRYRLSKKTYRILCKQLRQLTSLRSTQRVTLEVKVSPIFVILEI